MKRITRAVLTALTGAAFLLAAAGCDFETDHTHSYSSDWTSDGTYHWHAATCEHTDETSDKASHVFGEYTSNGDATTEADGTKTRKCSVCGYEETVTDAGSKLASHVHTYSNEWSKDDDYHWYACTNSGCTEVKDKASHTWDDGVITTEQTETVEGIKTYTCTVCSATKEENLGTKDHSHTISEAWSSDETNHWHEASCGIEAHNTDTASHTKDSGTVTTEAACTTAGVKTYKCSVCDYEMETEEIAALGHSYSAEWTSDDDNHWHACTRDGCTEVSEKAAHDWDDGEVIIEPKCVTIGKKKFTCQTCGATKTATVSSTGHSFSSEWTSDSSSHWHACTNSGCTTVNGKAAHSFGEYSSNNDATKNSDGTKTRSCTVCAYEETVTDTDSRLALIAAGDIVLTDGTFVSCDDFDYDTMNAAAVVVRAKSDTESVLAVGIMHKKLAWCSSDAAGYEENITALQGSTESGYTDGSDSWSVLQEACSDATESDASTYYPAWDYCLTYGTENSLDESIQDGWYLPALAELYVIYQNMSTIDESLDKAKETGFSTKKVFLSCCQSDSADTKACYFLFSTGNTNSVTKSAASSFVCAVRQFDQKNYTNLIQAFISFGFAVKPG